MDEIRTFDIEPVDEVRVYELLGDYAGVQGSRIEDRNGNIILNSLGNYDLYGPEHSFSGAHAFACYIRITRDGKSRYIMFDVGQNETALEQNIRQFGALDREFNPEKVEMILLSHGHSDHYYNINRALEIVNPGAKREIPIHVGGESFFRSRAKVSGEDFLDDGEYIALTPDRQGAEKRGGKWIVSQRPTLLMDNMVLYLGSIRPEARKLGIAVDYEMTPRPWPRFFQCDDRGDIVDRNTQDAADAEATARDLVSQDIRYIIPTHCSPWALVNLLWQENRRSDRPFMLTKNHLAPVGGVYTFSRSFED